jgi:ubiquinone/menaquinone biosynthesis C-methylase UbiE
MSKIDKNRVCPVEHAGSLDRLWRRLIQNPNKLLKNYIKDGMSVLDIGCGPGFFTIEAAKLAGERGKVVAADLQDGMLEIVKKKIQGTNLENIITLHKCEAESTGLNEKFDFILAFYIVHETPHPENFIIEMRSLLKAGGTFMIVEPSFHVTKKEFAVTLDFSKNAGLKIKLRPKMLFNRLAILTL